MNVFIYRNLHTKTWSVKFKKKVISHPKEILVKNATFFVSQKIRARVFKNKRKEVHAGVKGELIPIFSKDEIPFSEMIQVTYNPYLYDSFVGKSDLKKIEKSDLVFMNEYFEVWAKPPV
jgi:hypothetical protein